MAGQGRPRGRQLGPDASQARALVTRGQQPFEVNLAWLGW
jgi:hypothetical protein